MKEEAHVAIENIRVFLMNLAIRKTYTKNKIMSEKSQINKVEEIIKDLKLIELKIAEVQIECEHLKFNEHAIFRFGLLRRQINRSINHARRAIYFLQK
ncbi:MAG: hypothetical protein H6553_06765 [Chitinophagales bacterium]|nr:hypothetical protein [Chitinophagales bacterium]